ncbi:unnamed protein product [Fraxinus pennsylvanica]|uniref:Kri1-like C-terminal domain-containing protein n=1 Tax=Fraxinus pennsylvanica TaxID=56036 RepID=A0AAD1YRT9_9LAMI|nr:unnamed protein product [Fraxinus pennsylvanica]
MGKAKDKNGSVKLFDDDSNGLDDDVSKIEINQEFARRYEHNKKREDLQRIQELEKKGVVSFRDDDSEDSSSEEEEEDILMTSKKQDLKFFDALIKVKKQDPSLNSKEANLFFSDSESMSEDESDNKNENRKLDNNNDGRKGKKPMYLKDVVSKHLIEEGPEFNDEDDDDDEDVNNKNIDGNVKVKSFLEEQEESRREFLKVLEEAANVEDEEGDFLRVKNGNGKGEEDDGEIEEKLDDYFGEDEKLDEDTKFLKDYFRNKLWLDDSKSNNIVDEDVGFSEDEEEIVKQEDFERGYNFRFEENAGDRVMGHSRKVEGSVRKKENARKVQRERKEERMVQAEYERNEELKHLKNLKKKEIKEKLQKIREAAGIREDGNYLLNEDDLEEEFDPEEYDRKMKEAFDNKYYNAEDMDPEFGSSSDEDAAEYEKPDFDEEDRLLGLSNGYDEVKETGDGFLSARQRILKSKVHGEDENQLVEDEGNDLKEGKRKRKWKPSEVENAVREQLMEEYYKLDYEDTIGDLKTRFKYKPVKSKRFGLSTEEIFMLDDKELNQYVSMKKLAPYREKEWKVPRIKTYQQKLRNRALLEGETSNTNNKDNNKKGRNDELREGVVKQNSNCHIQGLWRMGKSIPSLRVRSIRTEYGQKFRNISIEDFEISYKVHHLARYYHQEEQGKTFDSLDRLTGVKWFIGESKFDYKENAKNIIREGVEFYSNGDYYEGEFHHGKCNGSGVYNYFANGRYEGDWIDGKYDGYGVESWSRGSRYRGQYRQGLRHGYGVYKFYTGDTYAGEWCNGQSHGMGVQSCADGSCYIGEFKCGVKHGLGSYHFRNGDRYAGEYFGDKVHGFGVYHFSNGHCYEGSWHEGRKQGYGMYTFRSGETRCGEWDGGNLKTSLPPLTDAVLRAVQAARKTAANAIKPCMVDEQVNKAVKASNRAANAARVAAVKAVQNRIDGKFCDTEV